MGVAFQLLVFGRSAELREELTNGGVAFFPQLIEALARLLSPQTVVDFLVVRPVTSALGFDCLAHLTFQVLVGIAEFGHLILLSLWAEARFGGLPALCRCVGTLYTRVVYTEFQHTQLRSYCCIRILLLHLKRQQQRSHTLYMASVAVFYGAG